ncbi:MAG: decaprenyl-phosphate phosphoribosyltransferase [Kiritimatiellae bacterium]|nr:decaprenyl-phosphate phosphoribosyltransferase [Kiritimatiellia bacterium]
MPNRNSDIFMNNQPPTVNSLPPPEPRPPAAASRLTLMNLARVMRPRQWAKNIVVLAAFFFALGDKQQQLSPLMFGWALLAAALFCITSSAVYIFNDIIDRQRDAAHPVKRLRPIASGAIPVATAWTVALILLGIGLGGAWSVASEFALTIIAYVVLQIAYTLWLKHAALVDVFVIAFGFVLRAIAGGFAVNVTISPWLLICTFLMALFLALCKRRHEKRLMEETQLFNIRPSLNASAERLLDQLIAIMAGAVIIAYAIYTQWPDTVAKFQTTHLSFTIPFVIFGMFRYLDLVYRHDKGDQPEYILLTDIPLIVDILFFGVCVWWIVIAV